MNKKSFPLFALALLLYSAAAPAQPQTLTDSYRIRQGETINDVAKRFLGSPDYATELLRFNEIANPAVVTEGFLLAIPGPERTECLKMLKRAEQDLVQALQEQVNTFAGAEFTLAQQALEAARKDRGLTAYGKSTKLSGLAIDRTAWARQVADRNARVAREGKITAVFGKVFISANQRKTWEPVRPGMAVHPSDILKTDAQSQAEIQLADGSEVQIGAATEFTIQAYLEDRRTGATDARLRVIVGEILGTIEPRKNEKSNFTIESGDASIAIRGTRLRVQGLDADRTNLMILDGAAEASLATAKRGPALVKTGEGLVMKRGEALQEPLPLLPPPVPTGDFAATRETALQEIDLEWNDLSDKKLRRRFDHFLVEISEDLKFNRIIGRLKTSRTTARTPLLPEGALYWRIASVDEDGLRGSDSLPVRFVVKKNYSYTLNVEGPAIPEPDQIVLGPQAVWRAQASVRDSSIQHLEYSLDNMHYTPFTDTFILAARDAQTLYVRGIGRDGKPGGLKVQKVFIDATPPIVELDEARSVLDAETAEVLRVAFKAGDEHGVARIEVSVNGRNFARYVTPIELTAVQDHTLLFRAVDELGNISGTYELTLPGRAVRR